VSCANNFFSSSAVMNLSRLGLSFSRRTRLIGFESISSLSKAIERIFERQARSRFTLAEVLGLGRSSLSCFVGVANRSRLKFSNQHWLDVPQMFLTKEIFKRNRALFILAVTTLVRSRPWQESFIDKFREEFLSRIVSPFIDRFSDLALGSFRLEPESERCLLLTVATFAEFPSCLRLQSEQVWRDASNDLK
jgi:hypothetical protein